MDWPTIKMDDDRIYKNAFFKRTRRKIPKRSQKLRCEDGVQRDTEKMRHRNWGRLASFRNKWKELITKKFILKVELIVGGNFKDY